MSDKTTELLPCPWCGVDMQLHAINYRWLDGKPGWYLWHENVGEAVRRKCPMEMGHYDTREEAIAACNTRAVLGSGTCEVECFDDGTDEGMDGEWFSYAPPTWYLSCGHTAQGAEKPNFCPNCGKRVER